MRVLRELTEIGMRLARSLDRRVAAEDEAAAEKGAAPAPAGTAAFDPAEAFSKLSRAIRLTVTLEEKADQALRDLEAGIARRVEGRAQYAQGTGVERKEALDERRRRIAVGVREAAEVDRAELSDTERADVDSLVDEWLENHESFWVDGDRPMAEVVDRLCRYFRFTPDWALWAGEGWFEPESPKEPWPWDERATRAKADLAEAGSPGKSPPRGLNGAAPHDLE